MKTKIQIKPIIPSLKKNLDLVLVILSSILLGIWAIKETIAFRNILLVSGTILSIYYFVKVWRNGELENQVTISGLTSIILLVISFAWVVIHYFFFSVDPVRQFEELKSTWLRSLMASIVGLATGVALRNRPNRIHLLWLGILVAFVVLFYQYLPRAIEQNKLLVTDYEYYLFHLKINTVLMGIILITGIDGALLDHLRFIKFRINNIDSWHLYFWILSTFLVLWAFVYIVDSRNGIGLSVILYAFWIICALVFVAKNLLIGKNITISLKTFLIAIIGFALVSYFAHLQSMVNTGWYNFMDDVKIAVQVDRYPHWQNRYEMGYPNRADGKIVATNTYERVAWATAGSKAIIQYPHGVGVLAYPFAIHPYAPPKMGLGPEGNGIATHSGWVELGLAFGVPILSLIYLILLNTFISAMRYEYALRMTALGLTTMIFCLYTVGELAIQHGLEILFYFLGLMPGFLLLKPKKILE